MDPAGMRVTDSVKARSCDKADSTRRGSPASGVVEVSQDGSAVPLQFPRGASVCRPSKEEGSRV